mgnify:FL=1
MPNDYADLIYSAEEIDDLLTAAGHAARYDTSQALTPAQQHQAQQNIGVTWPCNPNLLVNYDFRAGCLVDQRQGYVVPPNLAYFDLISNQQVGTTDKYYKVDSFTANGAPLITISNVQYYTAIDTAVRGYVGSGYGIDMFRQDHAACVSLIDDDGVTLIHSAVGITVFRWCFPAPTSGQYTASLLYFKSDGTLALLSRTFTVTKGAPIDVQEAIPGTEEYVFSPQITSESWAAGSADLRIFHVSATASGQQIKVVAAKWEQGDVSTLAHQDSAGNWVLNEVPSYADTLTKCQRYYYQRAYGQHETVGLSYAGEAWVTLALGLPIEMRTNPSVVLKGNLAMAGIGSLAAYITSFSKPSLSGTTLNIGVAHTPTTVGPGYMFSPDAGGATFCLSAEL